MREDIYDLLWSKVKNDLQARYERVWSTQVAIKTSLIIAMLVVYYMARVSFKYVENRKNQPVSMTGYADLAIAVVTFVLFRCL